MTGVDLLHTLKAETVLAVSNILLPTSPQENGTEPGIRTAEVHLMRLRDEKADWKKAPYIIHQVVTGTDTQVQGQHISCKTDVRSVFCVYSRDEPEGGVDTSKPYGAGTHPFSKAYCV